MQNKEQLQQYFTEHQSRFIEEWSEFLRFKSISMQPEHDADCLACAKWVANHLEKLGFKSQILPTSSKPVVYAERLVTNSKSTWLYYGHYDVQPDDPIELWTTPPFEPTVRNGRLYARGALDNKGQTFYVLKALEYLISKQALHASVKIVIEGEEECGSEGLKENLDNWKELLKADVLLVCDSETIEAGVPSITMGFRGVAHMTVELSGARNDLHSGVHGGVAPNPTAALARMIASLHDEHGTIKVKGFYDNVTSASPALREAILSMPFNAERYEQETGIKPIGGELKLAPQERTGLRPTIEIGGFHSGYGGPGVKTIIPALAQAKISTRLVAGQDPESALELIEQHLISVTPNGLKLRVTEKGIGGRALLVPLESKVVAHATQVLINLFGSCRKVWCGASIPVIGRLAEVSGSDPLLIGFGLTQDNMHAPDESFSIDQCRDGFVSIAAVLGSMD